MDLPPIAVVDVETTGLFPARHDRVVEIGIVVVSGHGRVQREFSSLVNPQRDVGPTSIHGITAADVANAPTFVELMDPMLQTLRGCVAVAGHNLRFDLGFLMAEFTRARVALELDQGICTMRLAGGGSLARCCDAFGVRFKGAAHEALADATAAAELMVTLLSREPDLVEQLRLLKPIKLPSVIGKARPPLPRADARAAQSVPPSYLQRLLAVANRKDTLQTGESDRLRDYVALLDRILEDRLVDTTEADALIERAEDYELSCQEIVAAHQRYFDALCACALSDGALSSAERSDLEMVARMLGIENLPAALMRTGDRRKPRADAHSLGATNRSLVGARICFTGELRCGFRGQLITREVAQQLAVQAGLLIATGVSKKVDVLVVADPHSQSGKARKARELGVRVMQEAVFWSAIGVEVD